MNANTRLWPKTNTLPYIFFRSRFFSFPLNFNISFAWNNLLIPESFFLSFYIEKIFVPTWYWWPKINLFVKTFLRVHNRWTSCKWYVLKYRKYQISHLNIFPYLRCTFSCAETNSNKIIFCYFKGTTKLCFMYYLCVVIIFKIRVYLSLHFLPIIFGI